MVEPTAKCTCQPWVPFAESRKAHSDRNFPFEIRKHGRFLIYPKKGTIGKKSVHIAFQFRMSLLLENSLRDEGFGCNSLAKEACCIMLQPLLKNARRTKVLQSLYTRREDTRTVSLLSSSYSSSTHRLLRLRLLLLLRGPSICRYS